MFLSSFVKPDVVMTIPFRSLTHAVAASSRIAFFGVGQTSSQTMQGVPWAYGRRRPANSLDLYPPG